MDSTMLAYVETCGQEWRDRGVNPCSDSMDQTQQIVCVYDVRAWSNHSGALHVEQGWPMDERHAREERMGHGSSVLHRTHAFSLGQWCIGYLHACKDAEKRQIFCRLLVMLTL